MTLMQRLVTIGVIILGTAATRFLPFLVFPGDKPTPKYIQYLGKMLPSAALGLLVIYCFKNENLLDFTRVAPALIAVAVTIALHFWKRQMLLSIVGGTILYMLMVQFVSAR